MAEAATQAPQPMKFARYRSVRRAAARQGAPAPPLPDAAYPNKQSISQGHSSSRNMAPSAQAASSESITPLLSRAERSEQDSRHFAARQPIPPSTPKVYNPFADDGRRTARTHTQKDRKLGRSSSEEDDVPLAAYVRPAGERKLLRQVGTDSSRQEDSPLGGDKKAEGGTRAHARHRSDATADAIKREKRRELERLEKELNESRAARFPSSSSSGHDRSRAHRRHRSGQITPPTSSDSDKSPTSRQNAFRAAPVPASGGRDAVAPVSSTSMPRRMESVSAREKRPRERQKEVVMRAASPKAPEDATFAPTGLLGRTYTMRQQSQRDRDAAASKERPPTSGHGHGHGGRAAPTSIEEGGPSHTAYPSPNDKNSTRKRSASLAQKPKPLLDFSNPEFREAPQHVRKGRGYVPEQPLPGGLVEAATSPDVAISIPPATAWRRPDNGEKTMEGRQTDAAARARYSPPQEASSGSNERKGLAGLLGRSRTTHGSASRGQGARTGDRRAKEPMLDLNETSKFAPGSLLARAQREMPREGPIIDRSRKK